MVALMLGASEGVGFSWRHLSAVLGERMMSEMDSLAMLNDTLITNLGQEVENGRLLRLLVKLGFILERLEGDVVSAWDQVLAVLCLLLLAIVMLVVLVSVAASSGLALWCLGCLQVHMQPVRQYISSSYLITACCLGCVQMSQWSETGDRYLLKLFHDFVFHQTNEDGTPKLEWGHVVECLNKVTLTRAQRGCA